MKKTKRLHDVEAGNPSDDGEGDTATPASADTDKPQNNSGKNSDQSNNAKFRVSDAAQYENFKAQVNSVGTAYLQVHHPELYRVYRTLEDFEREEVSRYLRTYLFQRDDDIGKFWAWLYWHTCDKRLNWSDFARLIGVNRTEITRKIRPKAIQAYAHALVKALQFYHYSTS